MRQNKYLQPNGEKTTSEGNIFTENTQSISFAPTVNKFLYPDGNIKTISGEVAPTVGAVDAYIQAEPFANKLLQADGSITLFDGTPVDLSQATEKYLQAEPLSNAFNNNGQIVDIDGIATDRIPGRELAEYNILNPDGSTINIGDFLYSAISSIFSSNPKGLFYDPYDLNDQKIGFRRNRLLWSEDLSNPIWNRANVTITDSDILAPNGTLTAQKITKNAASATINVGGTGTQNGNMRSIYARTVSGTGTVGLIGFSGIGAKYEFTITEEWQRFSVPYDNTETGAAFYAVDFRIGNLTEVILWGSQVEFTGDITPYQKITNFNSEFIKAFPDHTLFQDSLGTAPCTKNFDPIGLLLDKKYGGKRSEEKIINNDFSSGADNWDVLSGVIIGGKYIKDTFSGGGTIILRQNLILDEGLYEIVVDAEKPTLGGYSFTFSPSGLSQVFNNAEYHREIIYLPDGATTASIVARGAGLSSIKINSLSIKKIDGTHARALVSAARPLIRAEGKRRYFNFDGVDDALSSFGDFDIGGTTEMTIGLGIIKESDGGTGFVFQTSDNAGSTVGSFVFLAPSFSGQNSFRYVATVFNGGMGVGQGVFAPAPYTGSIIIRHSATTTNKFVKMDINQGDISLMEDYTASNGPLANHTLYIGARTSSSDFFNGKLYGLVITAEALPQNIADKLQKDFMKKMGISL